MTAADILQVAFAALACACIVALILCAFLVAAHAEQLRDERGDDFPSVHSAATSAPSEYDHA